jgi:hypothetical protein
MFHGKKTPTDGAVSILPLEAITQHMAALQAILATR